MTGHMISDNIITCLEHYITIQVYYQYQIQNRLLSSKILFYLTFLYHRAYNILEAFFKGGAL